MPAPFPVTIPVAEPTVAIAELLLLQLPLPDMSLNVVVYPGHKSVAPVIAAGDGLTVTIVVLEQPVEAW